MLTVALSITTEKSYNKLLFPLHGFGSFELGSYAKNPQVKKKVKTLKTYDQLYLKNVTHQSVVYVSKYKRITNSV